VSQHISITIKQGESFSGAVTGKLKPGQALQKQCEALLAEYEAGETQDARQKLNLLKQKHPDSMVVQQLDTLLKWN